VSSCPGPQWHFLSEPVSSCPGPGSDLFCHSLSSWASLRTGVAGCQMGSPTLASRASRPYHFPSHFPRCYRLDDWWAPLPGPVVLFWWSLSDVSPTPTIFTRSSPFTTTRRSMGVRHALWGATIYTYRLAWDEFEPDVIYPTAIPSREGGLQMACKSAGLRVVFLRVRPVSTHRTLISKEFIKFQK